MSVYTKGRAKKIAVVAVCSLFIGMLFQNCAKTSIAVIDLEAAAEALEAERIALGADEELVTVGLNGVPDLKMFFVVDNSGTMKENQLNLSDSFGAMFDAGSASSLSKFDTTAYLLSTAQSSPSLETERSLLDQIADRQKTFNFNSAFSVSDYNTLYRTSTQNSGVVPGDNIGFHLLKAAVAPQYTFKVMPVLGVESQSDGSGKWTAAIRKPASADPALMESSFKERLKILDANRIPLVQVGGQYKPENASIVDSESGLCTVARVLRNPESYIKSGDLFSFVIVSDENDNDPAGKTCIQSYKEFTGNEDLVDGVCKKKETTISYKPATVTTTPASCKIDGQKGYNYTISYPNTKYTTTLSYKATLAAAQYTVPLTTLTYQTKTLSYQYLHTSVSFYTETCSDIVSDGIVTGKKCVTNPTPVVASKAGNHTSDCFGLAKSFNSAAVNTAGYLPTCSTSYKASSACSAGDTSCKITETVSNKTVAGLLGVLTAAQCLTKAQTYGDFAMGTTPTCVTSSRTMSSCTAEEVAAGCVKTKEATIGTKVVTVNSDITVSPGCLNHAKTLSDSASTIVSDVSCTKNTVVETLSHNGQIAFAETGSLDGGVSVPVGDCGSLKDLFVGKAQMVKPQIASVSPCAIKGYYAATQANVALQSTCAAQAQSQCTASNLRACTGTLVPEKTTTTLGGQLVFNKVQEALSCSSLCSDSKLGACQSDALPTQTVAQYIEQKYGVGSVCSSGTVDISSGAVNHTAILASQEAGICKPSLEGVPFYFTRTKGPYNLQATEIDFVAGSKKDATGKTVPALGLVDYIKARSAELSQIRPIFTAIVRTETDALGVGGSAGLEYLKLVENGQAGQVASVLSKDYSVALKDLSKVLKEKIERSLVLKKMQAHQIITKVYYVPKGATHGGTELPESKWQQSGATLNLASDFEIGEGDQFRVEFQNYLK